MAPPKVSDEQVAEVLERAVGLFGKQGENWIKGQYHAVAGSMMAGRRDRFCAVGAINQAARSDQPMSVARDQARLSAKQALRQAIQLRGDIEGWNDSPSRQFKEVKAAFLQAAKTVRERASKKRLAGLP